MSSEPQPKTLSHVEITTYRVGMLRARISSVHFCSRLKEATFQKYAYADDLQLLYASQDWKAVEDTISQNMTPLSAYLETWRLKLSNTRTVTAVFHLNNREAKREHDVYSNGDLLPPCSVPTYLGVQLDRLLISVTISRLCAKTLRHSRVVEPTCGIRMECRWQEIALSPLFPRYTPQLGSTHTCLIDSILYNALRIVTGCLRPTPTEDLPVLAGIQPAKLRRLGATLFFANHAIHDPDHVLHGQLFGKQDAHQGRPTSRRPFVPVAWKLLDSLFFGEYFKSP